MAHRTPRLDLVVPEIDDMYDITIYGSMIEYLDEKMVVGVGIGSIEKLTEAQYDALETKNSATLYAVTGENSFRLMLGDLPMEQSGGLIPSGASTPLYSGATASIAGVSAVIEGV